MIERDWRGSHQIHPTPTHMSTDLELFSYQCALIKKNLYNVPVLVIIWYVSESETR